MSGKESTLGKGLYFILVSVLLAAVFYAVFGFFYRYEHPFFNYSLFLIFIGFFILLTIAVYLFSLKENSKEQTGLSAGRTRATVLIMVAALLVSAAFPAVSLLGLYPVTMAMFHLLILFYAGIAVAALGLSGVITLFRSGAKLSAGNKFIFSSSVILSLLVSYMCLYVFMMLPLN